MEFPLIILLLVFAVPLFVGLGMSLTNIYHVVRFGAFDARNRVFAIIFLFSVLGIVALVTLYFLPVDWSETVLIPFPDISFGQ